MGRALVVAALLFALAALALRRRPEPVADFREWTVPDEYEQVTWA